ncbi:MAG TPA: hypothetical protein VFX96_01325 [Pyrinomonadaceae bacterium]|nr:hypothetical protein [Pyrinomonadaceae bacterium]
MASRKSSGGGGGGKGVSAASIQKVLREAKAPADTSTAKAGAAAAIPDFCAAWRSKIRPLLMAAIGILKIFNKKAAEALAAAVAFIDGICGG